MTIGTFAKYEHSDICPGACLSQTSKTHGNFSLDELCTVWALLLVWRVWLLWKKRWCHVSLWYVASITQPVSIKSDWNTHLQTPYEVDFFSQTLSLIGASWHTIVYCQILKTLGWLLGVNVSIWRPGDESSQSTIFLQGVTFWSLT